MKVVVGLAQNEVVVKTVKPIVTVTLTLLFDELQISLELEL